MVKPEQIGLSASRLRRVDEVMKRRYVDSGRLPGMLTMVYRRGELAHVGMAGHMDLERDKPMREDAIFRIYSMTKPITSIAFMMFYHLIRRWGSVRAATVTYVIPAVTLVFDLLMNSHAPSVSEGLGVLGVTAGVVILNLPKTKSEAS